LLGVPINHPGMQISVKCFVCKQPFDFATGESAVILRHIAYGYDFVHDGACLAAARELIFVEPGFDRPAFSSDGQRARMIAASPAPCWAAVLPNAIERAEAGDPVSVEPLQFWAVVEYRDGSKHREGVIRDPEWLDEPGGAEFPEARLGSRASLGYSLDRECQLAVA
jgi:hypothetical protein